MFAARDIRRGEEIVEYKGARRTHADVDANEEDDGHTFLFTLNDKYVIDAGRGGNAARFINHSCEPNCEPWLVEGRRGPASDRVVIQARRRIRAGEELSYDYGITTEGPVTAAERRMWKCRCGASTCRGTMLQASRR